jgi:hypothetical protein
MQVSALSLTLSLSRPDVNGSLSSLFWFTEMGYSSMLCVESKVFDFPAVVGSSVLQILEKCMGVSQAVFLVEISMVWLVGTMESLLQGYGLMDFVKTSRVGSEAFNAQRCSNTHKHYMALADYRVGRRRAFTIIPERRGWRSCILELRKALSVIRFPGLLQQWVEGSTSCKPLGGFNREGFVKGGDVDLKPNPNTMPSPTSS